ncbi:Nuclease-related domain-containing protein [Mycetocola miduiensis]|uniref:Nuclease-related domain-containing protein n=1 Tax=Mycetocola miduiensis TaxID=995034 RepID=A0A1I4Z4A4_9MICO|nr:Nuclease-related domain-containing protein [Mycetocola miduiensis]
MIAACREPVLGMQSRQGGSVLSNDSYKGSPVTVTATSMRQRKAAQAVIEELLADPSHLVERGPLARIFGRSPLSSSGAAWFRGAQGEIAVGRMLDTLPADWSVFHALPVGTKEADIDHLVVGSGGVFSINTKHHRGKPVWVANRTLMVAGQRQPHIRNAEHEAARVTKLVHARLGLTGRVRPVVAIHGAASIVVKEQPDLVTVLDARRLRRWLLKRPVQFGPEDLTRIVGLVDDPATWRTGASAPCEQLLARFDELRGEVRTATTRRSLWSFGSLAVAGAGLIFVAPLLLTAMFTSLATSLMP